MCVCVCERERGEGGVRGAKFGIKVVLLVPD